jgi:4-hydroxybenzoyl-CoA thioesterase
MLVDRLEVRITWGVCDPAGIVYFPRYFELFDEATNRIFERVGFRKRELLKAYGIIGFPVVNITGNFTMSNTFGDDVVVETSIPEWGRSSFVVQHRLLKDEVQAVECREKRVWTIRDPNDPTKIRSQPIPEELKARFINPA